MANIGIMGGTFDPIHNGHLLLGRQAFEEYGLDEVWYMPSGTPPHKTDHHVTDVEDRCEMVRLAIADTKGFALSEFEAKRSGKTYTAETLRLLREEYPEHRFFFIIGADSLYQIESWYHPSEVLECTTLLVACREYPEADCPIEEQIAHLMEHYRADIRRLHCEEFDISSGELRELLAKGRPVFKYIPKAVERYIADHHLYAQHAPAKETE